MTCFNQKAVAAAFMSANKADYDAMENRAIEVAKRFCAEAACNRVSAEIVASLTGYLDSGDTVGFIYEFRQLASSFCPGSACYWQLIDAFGALSDASGVQWAYMTVAIRVTRLKHAGEHLDMVEWLLCNPDGISSTAA